MALPFDAIRARNVAGFTVHYLHEQELTLLEDTFLGTRTIASTRFGEPRAFSTAGRTSA